MTDDKRFFAAPDPATLPPLRSMRWEDWQSLPLAARIADKLVEMLVVACELRAELECAEAVAFPCVAPELDSVIERIEALLERLAS